MLVRILNTSVLVLCVVSVVGQSEFIALMVSNLCIGSGLFLSPVFNFSMAIFLFLPLD